MTQFCILQSSVATQLNCGGKYLWFYRSSFYAVDKVCKSVEILTMLSLKVKAAVYLSEHGVVHSTINVCLEGEEPIGRC